MRGTTIAKVAASCRRRRRHRFARAERLTVGERGDAPARARGDRRARLPAERRGPRAVDRPHARGRRGRALLHAAVGHRAPARRLAHARRRGLPADPARRRAGRAAARVLPSLAVRGRIDGVLSISLAPTERRSAACEWRSYRSCCSTARTRRCRRSRSTTSRAAGMAAEHLLALGHRRIAFVGDEEEQPRSGSTPSARGARASRRRSTPPARRSRPELVDAPAARPRRRARRGGRAAGARSAADGRLRELRRAGDRSARGGAGGRSAGARGVVGDRLRQRGGRAVHRPDHGRRSRSRRAARWAPRCCCARMAGEAGRKSPAAAARSSTGARPRPASWRWAQ